MQTVDKGLKSLKDIELYWIVLKGLLQESKLLVKKMEMPDGVLR